MEDELPLPIAEYKHGKVLMVEKPLEWTSFDAVNCIRAALRFKFKFGKIKVGHAGTLDPLATGLLIICTGKQTKQIDSYQAEEKEYVGTLKLGATTPSYDAELEEDKQFETLHITEQMIYDAVAQFVGKIEQIPPKYSALKIDGIKACDAVRQRKEVKMRPREIEIREFEITAIRFPEVDFRVVCSKGTYIRTLADDFGRALDSGAYLVALRRTRIGAFTLEGAKTPHEWRDHFSEQAEKYFPSKGN